MSISDLLNSIKSSQSYENQIFHIEERSYRQPEHAAIELKPLINYALDQKGIKQLYSHQVEAIQHIRSGKDIVLVTSTASGKSLSYMIPIIETVMDDPKATALYISPLNALVNDQLKSFLEFRYEMGIEANINKYVGTMNGDEKREVRDMNPQIILTNPEMIHLSLLQWHHLWKRYLSNLKFIVVDESHHYRGFMGSNMANLLRRLNRMCTYYGANPQYICCSATIGNPGEHTRALIGRNVTVINKDGSGQGPQKFIFWNPPLTFNEKGFNERKSTFGESHHLFNRFVQFGLQTIVFTRSRQVVERMSAASISDLREKGLTEKISPYRAGYSVKEREEIEKKLSDGNIRGVISTNALELGINIGGLDACIIDGYPGTVMSTRQQAGRAGRGNKESIVVLVASSNALDQYYMQYPKEFFERNCEEAVLNVSNPYIQADHVLCAAKEKTLTSEDEKYFGTGLTGIIELLEGKGKLTRSDGIISVNPNPYEQVSIRGIDRDAYSIFVLNAGTKVSIENDLGKAHAFKEAFEGAIYYHLSTPYHVSKLDHEKKEIFVEETNANYYTKALVDSEIFIKERKNEKTLPSCKDAKVGLGRVEVIEQVTGYKKIRFFSEKVIGEESLEMPKLSLETVALWIELPDIFNEPVQKYDLNFFGGIQAIENAMIAMYPLRLLADRNDVGGISTPSHCDLNGKCGIFVYDGHRGGVGYAERGYEIITDILEVTLKAIEGCSCYEGCPSCIQSQKWGNHNDPLDKNAALIILHELLGKAPYIPKKAKPQKIPVPPQKKSDNARQDALKTKEPSTRDFSPNGKKQVSSEEIKHQEEIKFCEKQLEINPKNWTAWYNKGLAHYQLGNYNTALNCYDKALNIDPKNKDILNSKGDVLDKLGRRDDAKNSYNKALKISPNVIS